MSDTRRRNLQIKRALDIAASAIGLVLLAPAFIAISAGIRLKMGKPVFFIQTRPGRNAVPFRMVKFRTMVAPAPGEAWESTDEIRMTRMGRCLRDYSLDEVPELFNVLKGDMSLVGPRPLLMEYLRNYTLRQTRRHQMRPGMTGWAQVRGRRSLPLSERLELDVWYVENWSLRLDLRILLATPGAIFRDRGDIRGQTIEDVDDTGLWSDRHPPEGNDG